MRPLIGKKWNKISTPYKERKKEKTCLKISSFSLSFSFGFCSFLLVDGEKGERIPGMKYYFKGQLPDFFSNWRELELLSLAWLATAGSLVELFCLRFESFSFLFFFSSFLLFLFSFCLFCTFLSHSLFFFVFVTLYTLSKLVLFLLFFFLFFLLFFPSSSHLLLHLLPTFFSSSSSFFLPSFLSLAFSCSSWMRPFLLVGWPWHPPNPPATRPRPPATPTVASSDRQQRTPPATPAPSREPARLRG